MTKQDLIRHVSERTGLAMPLSQSVIESFFAVVQASLLAGEPIYIRTFGSFGLKERAAKVGRHIRQNQAVPIGAHRVPYFKPSAVFSDQVRAQPVLAEPKKAKQ